VAVSVFANQLVKDDRVYLMANEIKAEGLAYWYLRLNGFLTIVNFVVHPDTGSDQRTDVDILGVRFPHRAELLRSPMQDDDLFTGVNSKPYIAIAEVKKGTCKLNGPWTRPADKNMHRVLRAIGAFPDKDIEGLARALYEDGCADQSSFLTLLCIGGRENPKISKKYPRVPQILWDRALKFIFNRFRDTGSRRFPMVNGTWMGGISGIGLTIVLTPQNSLRA
jgi:hypothetical protein